MGGISVDNKVVNGGQVPKLSSGSGAPVANGVDHEIYLDWQNNNLWQWALNAWNLITSGIVNQDLNTTLLTGNTTDQTAQFQTTSYDTIISPTGLNVFGPVQAAYVDDARIAINNGSTYVKLTIAGVIYQNATHELLIGLGFAPSTKNYLQSYMAAEGYLLCGATGRATLSSGQKTVTVGSNTPLTPNSTFQFSINTASGTQIGVAYKGTYISATQFSITSLKTNGGIETSDNSTIDYTVITVE